MRILRALIVGSAVLIALALGAMFFLPHMTDVRVLKKELAGRLAETAGREVRIDGALAAALLPTPGLRVSGLRMAEPGGFGNGTMMQCGSLHAGLDLFSLFRGKLAVVRFDIEDFIVKFHKDSSGRSNWDGLFPGQGQPGADGKGRGDGPVLLDNPDLFIRNATVALRDDSEGIAWSLADSGLHLDGESRKYELETVFSARRLHTPLRFRASGRLDGGPATGRAVLQDTRLTLDYDLDGPGGAVPAKVAVDLVMDLYRGDLNATKIVVESPGLSAAGALRVADVYDAWTVEGDWKAASSDVGTVCREYRLPVPAFAENASNARAGAEFHVLATMHSLALTNASLSFADTIFKGTLEAKSGNRTWFAVNGTANYLDFADLALSSAGNASNGSSGNRTAGLIDAVDAEFNGMLDVHVQRFRAGELKGRNLIVDADFSDGKVIVRRFNADFDRGGLQGSGSGTIRPGTMEAEIAFTLNGLEEGRRTGPFNPLMTGSLRFHHDSEGVAGHASVDSCDPRNVLWALNLEWPKTISPHAAPELKAAFDFSGTPGKWSILNVRAAVDRTHVHGRLSRNRGGTPAWDFTARINSLNLDAWAASGTDEKASALGHLFAWLDQADFRGDVRLDRLVLKRQSYANVRALLNAGRSRLTVRNGALEWSGGKGTVNADLSVSGKQVALSGECEAEGLPAEAVAEALGLPFGLKGNTDIRLSGSARGTDGAGMLRTLAADMEMHAPVFSYSPDRNGDEALHFRMLEARIGVAGAEKQDGGTGTGTDVTFSLSASEAEAFRERVKKWTAGGEMRLGFDGQGSLDSVRVPRFAAKGVPEAFTGGPLPVSLSLTGEADIANRRGSIRQAELSGPGFTANARVSGAWGRDWSVQGELALPDARPGKLWTALYDQVPRRGELLHGSVNIGFSKKKNAPAELDLRLGVDRGTLSGRFTVRDFSKPDMDFHLLARDLNLDRWRDPDPETEEEDGDKPGAVHWADEVFPLLPLRTPSVRGRIELENTRACWVHWGNATITLNGMLGKYEIRAADGNLYGGKGDLWLRVRTGRQDLSAETSVKMDGVESGRFIAGLAGGTVLRGPADLNLAASSRGNSWRTLAKNLAGRAGLTIARGAAIPRAEGKQRQEIPFDDLTAQFKILNGIISSNDMQASAAAYSATGKGYLDLPRAVVDYTVNARGPAVTSVPITISGPLDDVQVDVSSLGIFMDSLGRVINLPLQPLYFIKDLLF